MSRWSEKVRVAIGNITLELPAAIGKRPDVSIDSTAGVFEGAGLRIVVDQGPFANRLDSYAGLPDYREESRDAGGMTARIVSFRSADGRSFTAAIHLPAPKSATVIVEADADIPPEVPAEIIDSLRWVERSPE